MDEIINKFNDQTNGNKLISLQERIESLKRENNNLKYLQDIGQKDTHEFVAYFQLELEKKDNIIDSLNDKILQLQCENQSNLKNQKEEYEKQIEELRADAEKIQNDLKQQLNKAQDELDTLAEFRKMKISIETELANLRETCNNQKIQFDKDLKNEERKHILDLSRLQKETEKKLIELSREARVEAQKNLDADTRKIVADNRRMAEELKFQMSQTSELQKINIDLETTNKQLVRELSICKEKETLYAEESLKKNEQIKELTERLHQTECQMREQSAIFQREKNVLELKQKKEEEDYKIEIDGLHHLVQLKNKELRGLRQLSQTILDQRTDVEQYFIDALDQVKKEISNERQQRYEELLSDYNKNVKEATKGKVKFPTIKTIYQLKEESSQENRIPIRPTDKVDLRDLSLEDRERVLRLLFAKINGVYTESDERSNQPSRNSNTYTPNVQSMGESISQQPHLE